VYVKFGLMFGHNRFEICCFQNTYENDDDDDDDDDDSSSSKDEEVEEKLDDGFDGSEMDNFGEEFGIVN
jgi:hypothetical protein